MARENTNSSQAEGPAALANDLAVAVEHAETLTIEHVNKLTVRTVTLGFRQELERYLESLVRRLSLPGDMPRYRVEIVADTSANASMTIDGTRHLRLNVGLFSLAKTESELAWVIAHELTHANPNQATVLGQITQMDEVIPRDQQRQREELRADLGAMERVIRAGFNPWGGYNFFQRLENEYSDGFEQGALTAIMADHPATSLRTTTMKAYFLKESQTRNFGALIANDQPLPAAAAKLGARTKILGAAILAQDIAQGVAHPNPAVLKRVALLAAIATFAEIAPAGLITAVVNFVGHSIDFGVHGFLQFVDFIKTPSAASLLLSLAALRLSFTALQVSEEGGEYLSSKAARADAWKIFKALRNISQPGDLKRLERIHSLYTEISRFHERLQTMQIESIRVLERASWNGLGLVQNYANHATEVLVGEVESYIRGIFLADGSKELFIPSEISEIFSNLRTSWLSGDQMSRLDRLAADVSAWSKLTQSGNRRYSGPGIRHWMDRSVLREKIRIAEEARDGLTLVKELRDFVNSGLSRSNQNPYFRDVLRRNYGLMAQAIFNRNNPDPSLVDTLYALHKTFLNGNGNAGVRELQELRQSVDGAAWLDRLTIMSHTQALPVSSEASTLGVGMLMDAVNKRDRHEIFSFFENQIHSVSQLETFVREEVIPRRMNLHTLAPFLYIVVDRHPEWLQNPNDVQALLRNDYFWPKADDSRVRSFEHSGAFDARTHSNSVFDEMFFSQAISKKIEFDLALSERLQLHIRDSLQKMGAWPSPQNLNRSRGLWKLLVARGVTPVTDELIFATHAEQPAQRQEILEGDALGPPRLIWDEAAHGNMLEVALYRRPEFQELMSEELPAESPKRRLRLQQLLSYLSDRLPDRGVQYQEILERLSRRINSSENESKMIMGWRRLRQDKDQQDRFSRYFSGIITAALNWQPEDQWALVRFFRGENVESERVNNLFARLGPARVRQAYQGLPIQARTAFFDALFDGSGGYLQTKYGTRKRIEENTKRIVNYLLQGSDANGRVVASEIMEAFLHSLGATGNEPLRSSTLAYLLAQPSQMTDSGEVLKNVLENFGTAGVKIGQFLVASGTLPPEINRALRSLQDHAREPSRAEIYRDLREILQVPEGTELPYAVNELLGSASIKYAVAATNRETGERVVLKILRREAITHTEQEFAQLNAMAQFLERRHGSRYGVFRSIIRAAEQAVKRELNLPDEVGRGEVAARIYNGHDRGNVGFYVPKERLLASRLIEAEFIPGASINDLEPEQRRAAASAISDIEWQNFHLPEADSNQLTLCPDRHPGNYRIHVDPPTTEHPEGHIKVGVIDFGQLIEKMPNSLRSNVFDLFAYAQALKAVGTNHWAVSRIVDTLKLTKVQARRLQIKLRGYFPAVGADPVNAYFSILAALDDAGAPQPIEYYDYVRGMIQTVHYEELAREGATQEIPLRSARASFDEEVRRRGARIESEIHLTPFEKAGYAWREFLRWHRGQAVVALEADEGVGGIVGGAGCRPERLIEVMRRLVRNRE